MNKITLILILFFSSLPARAGELDPKMDSIIKQFARDAGTKGITPGATAAVFPYNCDEKLAKKRVDIAIVELLTARLLSAGTFRLVERVQLETVLKEQKLSLSGAIESATAAQVGRLAGARLAVQGNVIRVGRVYQISSKLVDTESAEIISASIVEVPVETFDEEAARYLVLVPEREALGFYTGFSAWPVKTKTLPAVTIPGTGGIKLTPTPKSGSFAIVTVGVRYQVAKKWILDAAFAPVANLGPMLRFEIPPPNAVDSPSMMDGMGGRLSINYSSNLSRKWRSFYGLGYQLYGISYGEDSHWTVGTTKLDGPTGGANVASAFGRAGFEWRVKERFGWSFIGQVNQPSRITYELTATPASGPQEKIKAMQLDLPVFMVDTTFAFYF